MRKYILNPGIISAVTGVIGSLKTTKASESKLRIIATWVAFGAALALAIASVREQAEKAAAEQAEHDEQREQPDN